MFLKEKVRVQEAYIAQLEKRIAELTHEKEQYDMRRREAQVSSLNYRDELLALKKRIDDEREGDGYDG